MLLAEAIYARLPAPRQSEMISVLERRLRTRRFGERYQEADALLREVEGGDPALGKAVQERLLRDLVARAVRNIAYYRDLFASLSLKATDIRTTADLQQPPIMSKQMVRDNRRRLVSERYAKRDLIYVHTSSSTGAGLELLWDANVDAWSNAALWRQREWAGVPFGVPYGTLFGSVVHPRARIKAPFWCWNRPPRQLILASFHLAPAKLDSYATAIERYQLRALEAYSSAVATIAKHVIRQGRPPPAQGCLHDLRDPHGRTARGD